MGLLFTASLINYVDRGTISVALPLIARDFHFGPGTKGVLLAAFFASYALMQVPVGWAVDHLNLRRFFAIMFLIWCASQGLTGLAAGLGMLIFFRMLLGIGESIYFPGGVKIVSVLFAPAERGLPTGIFNSGIKAGLAIGAPLTALLIQRFGWRHMFLIIGLLALLWLVPWLAIFPSRFPKHYKSSSETGAAPSPRPRRFVTFDRNLVGICLGFFCWDYYFYLFLTWLPDYLMTVRHFRMLAAGLFAALPYLVFMVAEPLGGWIADRLVRHGWSETIARKS
ncbi:MAG: MFS transporter, partial [Candidatus Acidiferrales bacterium]